MKAVQLLYDRQKTNAAASDLGRVAIGAMSLVLETVADYILAFIPIDLVPERGETEHELTVRSKGWAPGWEGNKGHRCYAQRDHEMSDSWSQYSRHAFSDS